MPASIQAVARKPDGTRRLPVCDLPLLLEINGVSAAQASVCMLAWLLHAFFFSCR